MGDLGDEAQPLWLHPLTAKSGTMTEHSTWQDLSHRACSERTCAILGEELWAECVQ